MESRNPLKRMEDRGGRRKIKDRRVNVSNPLCGERRTGLRRRSGYDRRLRREDRPGGPGRNAT
jgi:hypothetical protein